MRDEGTKAEIQVVDGWCQLSQTRTTQRKKTTPSFTTEGLTLRPNKHPVIRKQRRDHLEITIKSHQSVHQLVIFKVKKSNILLFKLLKCENVLFELVSTL